MKPQFDDQLNMSNHGRALAAGGPCIWEQDDEWAEIREVEVRQGNVVASSRDRSTMVREDSDPAWWLDVDSTGQFGYGPAEASARAVVHRTDGTTYEYEWPDAVVVDMPLQLEEIQGNVVAGFSKDHTSYLFFALPDEPAQARAWLADLVDEVATAQEVKQFNDLFRAIRKRRGDREGVVEAAWMNLAFTHEGLGKLGVDKSQLRLFPEEFREGMRNRKQIIGDVDDNDPDLWPNGLGTRTIHALMILAADSVEDLNREVLYFVRHAASNGVSLVFQQDGMTRPDAPGYEHFGFRDGISQPAIRGLATSSYPQGSDQAVPPQDVIAGGEFVLGYPRQQPSDPADDPLTPRPDWTENGSYLVFRRLRQDVRGFQDFLSREAARLGTTVDLLGAKLVGRYRSGAPLVGAGNATQDPGTTKPDVLEKHRINAFGYSTDPDGTQVPRAAHIRKAYPRDQEVTAKELRERPADPPQRHPVRAVVPRRPSARQSLRRRPSVPRRPRSVLRLLPTVDPRPVRAHPTRMGERRRRSRRRRRRGPGRLPSNSKADPCPRDGGRSGAPPRMGGGRPEVSILLAVHQRHETVVGGLARGHRDRSLVGVGGEKLEQPGPSCSTAVRSALDSCCRGSTVRVAEPRSRSSRQAPATNPSTSRGTSGGRRWARRLRPRR
jgi:deferrochelatase/peroxidase EfeB